MPLSAQTFENFKRNQNEAMSQAQTQTKAVENAQVEAFKKYKDEKDTQFHQFLKSQWEAYNAQNPDSLYEEPKPNDITPAQERKVEGIGPKITIEITPSKESVALKEIPKDKTPESKNSTSQKVYFDFYGSSFSLNIPDGVGKAKYHPQTQEGISNFFDGVAMTEYAPLIKEIDTLSKSLNLNDWGSYQLVLKLSEKLFANKDEAKLMSWFLLNKLGYAVKVGLADKTVVLMHYSQKTIYDTPNYVIDSKRYYVISNYAKRGLGALYTYKQNYPDAEKALDLALTTLPNLSENIKSKTLSFKQYGNEYKIPYEYNQNLIDFMASYPQADYETFFNAPIEGRSYRSIAVALKKHIDAKKASEAMNFVLSFVQNAFIYKIDSEQFGHEKVMFAQETLYFDKSDCEDRAVLFSYLVKELFGVGVVGVKYRDHMATALYVPIRGDSVNTGSKKYVIADPTYINSSIGESMPKYRPIKPERFIVVSASTKRL